MTELNRLRLCCCCQKLINESLSIEETDVNISNLSQMMESNKQKSIQTEVTETPFPKLPIPISTALDLDHSEISIE